MAIYQPLQCFSEESKDNISFSKLSNDNSDPDTSEQVIIHQNLSKKYNRNSMGRYQSLQCFSKESKDNILSLDNDLNGDFQFSTHCFLCSEEITAKMIENDKKLPAKRRNNVYHVSRHTTKETLMKALQKTSLTYTTKILERIADVDLVHAQARYHKRCYIKVFDPRRYFMPSNLKRGRPRCSEVSSAMDIIFDYIEKNKDSQYSISELTELLSDFVPSDHTIKTRLKEKYGEKILITTMPGHSSVVTLIKNPVDEIVTESRHSQRNISDHDEEILEVQGNDTGSPQSCNVSPAMDIIFHYIKSNKDSQFSINELREVSDYLIDEHMIIKKLMEKYGEKIFITEMQGCSPIVTLKDAVEDTMKEPWYKQRIQIVTKAAEIVREDICLKTNTKGPINSAQDVPETLKIFLKILAGEKSEIGKSISSAIYSACMQSHSNV